MTDQESLMHTEADAQQKKICPLSMVTAATELCQGARCMAWRWDGERAVGLNEDTGVHHYVKTGYCGLAGKP